MDRDLLLSNMYDYRCRYVQTELDAVVGTAETITESDEENITAMHYFGNKAVDEAFRCLCVKNVDGAKILDAGSGFGGASRYWTQSLNRSHKLVACEYQASYNSLAHELTQKSPSRKSVEHIEGDLVTHKFAKESFDGIFSILVVCHIDNRVDLFRNLLASLKPGGYLYIEDLYFSDSLTASQRDILHEAGRNEIAFSTLPTRSEYVHDLTAAGFEVTSFTDMTDGWKGFTKDRRDYYESTFDSKVALHNGEQNGPRQFLNFFNAVVKFFENGGKGARIVAQKIK